MAKSTCSCCSASISIAIAEGPTGAVIDIPYTVPQTTQAIGDIFFQQTIHNQPIPYRLEGVGPNMVYPTVRDNPFFERIHNLSQQQGTAQDAMCAGTQDLVEMGFRYVVLRQDSLDNPAVNLNIPCLSVSRMCLVRRTASSISFLCRN